MERRGRGDLLCSAHHLCTFNCTQRCPPHTHIGLRREIDPGFHMDLCASRTAKSSEKCAVLLPCLARSQYHLLQWVRRSLKLQVTTIHSGWNNGVSLNLNPALVSYQGINKPRDRMEIFRHNSIEPGMFRKLATLPEALTSSIPVISRS